MHWARKNRRRPQHYATLRYASLLLLILSLVMSLEIQKLHNILPGGLRNRCSFVGQRGSLFHRDLNALRIPSLILGNTL